MTPAPAPASGPLGAAPVPVASRVHFPSLLAALAIMLVGSIYPLLFADASGKADHSLAMALFWAMSAGLVRGVGFVPRWFGWRWLFSGWACAAGLLLATWLRWGA
ncbi:cyd operon YbgE family protein [Hydrogenophaga sp.]|jgi:predicted membrane protein|uniref:cyd operon YbgE family protein n=1 Tax=Hydrogenophaga sp. TaxID=1904254 RepID=UPI002723D702|nr:cyd operon YbgE family protein [Hydrogenophaga sp.]MDO9251224.1 cyd operon YbgE family protein [Hydrogenophaga sp.]MDP3346600.1 cyd operon YbgE family protein [Hydrogenophaga sp.]MDP3886860.1 cyd operon YbgE family protein [Hydrogenophaga sp.]